MSAFLRYLPIQLKMDVRDRSILLHFYLVPLLFFFVMGSVFTSTNPQMKATLAATMTIFAVTMGAVMGTPMPLVQMRESGTLRAFKVSGIPGGAVLAVQALSACVHLFIASLIIYFVAPSAFHADWPKATLAYFAVLVIYLLASIAVGLFIGVISKNASFASMLAMVIFLPSLLLSGMMFPTSLLPKVLQWAGRIFPATYALQAFDGFAYQMKTNLNAGGSLVIIAVIGLVLALATLFLFSRLSKVR
ncbi:ABC transporter permease [Sporolactobacillus pectinivorans]|uniref:ABC transporter permease n=1 Tax=Sporolactobacillus pectinivorans TaxID=1591408 RepID=UPI000C26B6D5|nr:ABC transporter permease [Sporolactobacillus pectinivorans]